jgi:hypothetical protein
MRENRTNKRVAFRNTVHFGPSPHKPYDHKSFAADLSSLGACIKTDTFYRPGTILYMIIGTDDKSYGAEGVVTWAKKVSLKFVRIATYSTVWV